MKKIFTILTLILGMVSAANATTYNVWVKGAQVSSTNYADILGDGTVSYNDATKTLTLNNATISCDGKTAINIAESQPFTIECIGTNTITTTGNGFAVANTTIGGTTFTGSGSINMSSESPTYFGVMGLLTIQKGCSVTMQSASGGCIGARVITVDGANLVAKGNGKVVTITCSGLTMKNGVQICSNHTFDAEQKIFLNAAGEEAKDEIIIRVDERTVVKELDLSNLHAPTAGSVYTNDSMRGSIHIPQDAVYGLKEGSVKLYKMATSGAAQVEDNTTITTGRYYVVAQVSINEDAKEDYRFPNQLKDIKTKSVSPRKWRLKTLLDNENIVCYSDTFTVFTAYAFPDELPDDLTELRGDTFRIYGINGNMISLSDASANYKDLASSLEYHPNEFGYNPSLKRINLCFGGTYWNILQTSTMDWVDVYFAKGDTPFTYDYSYQPPALPTERPDMKGASLVVCGTNIENYFSNYKEASKQFNKSPATEQEFITKTQKVVSALTTIDAQIYAIYEIGTGQSIHVLCDSLNKRYPNHPYAPLDCKFSTSTYQSVAYIYDSTRLDLVSAPTCMYSTGYMYYRMSRVTFRERASQQELILSASHLKAFDDGESERIQQVTKLMTALRPYKQKNVLIIGDMNSHSLDVPCQMLVDEYDDLLYLHDSLGFSYLRGDGVAFLDHAFASPSLTPYVTMATTMHVNTLAPTNYGFSSGDTTMYRFADHDPLLVGLDLPSPTGLEGLTIDNAQCTMHNAKFLHNGHLLIKTNNATYTLMGQKVK